MLIRNAVLDDSEAIALMNLRMAHETEDKGLDPSKLRSGVNRALADDTRGFYLVAEREGEVVGTLFVTREWSDWRDAWFWWIQSVYVLPKARRGGVYRALHDEVKARASAAGGVCGVRLYVERDNRSAQETYVKMGMHETHYRLFEQEL